jgi:hypothetical protein
MNHQQLYEPLAWFASSGGVEGVVGSLLAGTEAIEPFLVSNSFATLM